LQRLESISGEMLATKTMMAATMEAKLRDQMTNFSQKTTERHE